MDIGSRIRNSRIRNNMTQEEFAQKLCVTSQAVSRWKCGISLPDTAMIPIIAKTLCISADELLGCENINVVKFDSCRDLDCFGNMLNQSQIDSILEENDIVSDGRPKKVLIVDDSDFMRMMLMDILTRAGHTVIQADNGKSALKMLENEKADICFLDIMMPEMNGIEVLKWMRVNTPELSVIMLSALCNEVNIRDALRIGASSFVAKPFTIDTITKRV